jgi:putative ABC transport system ATP-binding protein
MQANPQYIIQARNLSKQVVIEQQTLTILQGVDLSIKPSETLAIVGSSGSGKTTLLSLLAGLDTPSSGEVYIADYPLHQLDEEQRSAVRAKLIGFIFQQFLLVNSLTALENVMLPAELNQQKNANALALSLLEEVGLAHRLHHYPSQLSGGEQQRVAIARAFITRPSILFADEPTGNLDTKTGQHIEQLLFDLNERFGTTLVLVTHDLQLAKRCQRQMHFEAGKQLVVEG